MDDFSAVTDDAKNPNLVGWELFIETHGLKIYRLYRQVNIK